MGDDADIFQGATQRAQIVDSSTKPVDQQGRRSGERMAIPHTEK
jgi:hypothetical protein